MYERKQRTKFTTHITHHTRPILLLFCLIRTGILIESVLSVLKVHRVGDDADTSERNPERETSHKDFVERRLKGGRILYSHNLQCEYGVVPR